VARRSA